jgi:hypothetical protein
VTADAHNDRQPVREVGGIDRFGFWHNLTDLSADDGGGWWWACSCDDAGGGHSDWHAARTGWKEHLAVVLAEVSYG